jgi:hypothetical protein
MSRNYVGTRQGTRKDRTESGSYQKNLGPLEKPLEIADYVFCLHKKITSHTTRNSGALIVKMGLLCKSDESCGERHLKGV